MNILDIAIAKKLAGGGGGSGTDNYNDLSNLPKINDTTLSGNKSSSALGLQSEINSDSKLASDLVDDTNQDNKFVTSTEKNTWNGKQNAIDADHKINADYVDDSTSTNKFVTASDKETWNAKQNAIDNSHKLSSDLVDDANHTNKFVTSTEKQTWNAKQNAIDADHKLSSSLVSFTDAEAAALASGINSSKVGQISTNQTNILYAIGAGGKNLLSKFQYYDNADKVTVNADGSITLNVASSSYDINIHFALDPDGVDRYKPMPAEWVGKYFSGMVTANNALIWIMELSDDGSTWKRQLTIGTVNQKLEIPNDGYYKFTLKIIKNNAVSNYTLKPMIADEIVYDTIGAGQPPALPNYDLTRLESEDRASLAEVVDSGAKNLLDFANLTSQASSNVTVNKTDTQITVTTNNNTWGNAAYKMTLAAGTYYYSCKISNLTVASGTRACIVLDSGSDGHGTRIATFDVSTGTVSFPFVWTGGTLYIFYYPGYTNTANSNSFTAAENMICTKAAFCLSNKFVPYRPNYDLVCRNILKRKYINYYPHTLTWTKSSAGKYYSQLLTVDGFSIIYAVTLAYFRGLSETEIIETAVNSDGTAIQFYSTTDAFIDPSMDEIGVVVIGI